MKTELTLSNSKLSCASSFFAPVDGSQLEQLFASYNLQKKKIIDMHSAISGEDNAHTLDYFTNSRWDAYHNKHFDPRQVFTLEPAIAYLDATFWKMALNMTDVYEHMPNRDREQWDDVISEHKTASFDEDTVISTLQTLLNNREIYLSQRVQDIFEGLSGDHVTNSPAGFNKRMIFYIGDRYSTVKSVGLLNDLRDIIARLSNRGKIAYSSTSQALDGIYSSGATGKWLDMDGGAFRVRCYIKLTAHVEVHPDICWRLNEILAVNNPRAIPAEFRRKPEKKYKSFNYSQSLIPFDVLDALHGVRQCYGRNDRGYRSKAEKIENRFEFSYGITDKHTMQKAVAVLEAMGGVKAERGYQFDYNFLELLPEILRTGSLPDVKSHQFYPTKPELAEIAASHLSIQPGDKCLEPSAGQGGLLKFMPKNTTAIEISAMQCEVLKLKGYENVINQDFIEYASKTADRFDSILMNPPFSQKRHEQHLHSAMRLLSDSGSLVAILPVSAKKLPELEDFKYKWLSEHAGAFDGVSVTVALLKVNRA